MILVNGLEMRAGAPLVSVIVVSYNHARYLRCCLESVFDQTYSNIECIVVDNASTDESRDVITHFQHEVGATRQSGRTLDVHFSPDNLHLTKAMIAGFRRSKGAFVAFVDADDYFRPACIETHVRAFLVSRWPVGATAVDMYQTRDSELVTTARKQFSEYVLSGAGQRKPFCRMDRFDDLGLSRLPEGAPFDETDLHLVDRRSGAGFVWSPTSALCFRREAVALMFAHEPTILAGTDTYLIRGISALTGSITIDRPLAVYRQHGGNMFAAHPALMNFDSHDKVTLAADEMEIVENIIACYRGQMASLAKRLAWPDLYIEAVDTIARVGRGLPAAPGRSSYTVGFVIENRDAIIEAFGRKVFDRWCLRYARLREIPYLLRRLSGSG